MLTRFNINLRVVTTVIEPRLRKANTVSLSTGSSGVRFSGEKVQKFTATNGAKLLSEIRDSAKKNFRRQIQKKNSARNVTSGQL